MNVVIFQSWVIPGIVSPHDLRLYSQELDVMPGTAINNYHGKPVRCVVLDFLVILNVMFSL